MKGHRKETTAGKTRSKAEQGKGGFECPSCGPQMMDLMRSMAAMGRGTPSDRTGCCPDNHRMSEFFSTFLQRKGPAKQKTRGKK
jgi:hypothetical protein